MESSESRVTVFSPLPLLYRRCPRGDVRHAGPTGVSVGRHTPNANTPEPMTTVARRRAIISQRSTVPSGSSSLRVDGKITNQRSARVFSRQKCVWTRQKFSRQWKIERWECYRVERWGLLRSRPRNRATSFAAPNQRCLGNWSMHLANRRPLV